MFSTKILDNPSDDVMKVIDYFAKRKFPQIENLNYFNINILLYIDAATSKECVNALNENYIKKTESESANNG